MAETISRANNATVIQSWQTAGSTPFPMTVLAAGPSQSNPAASGLRLLLIEVALDGDAQRFEKVEVVLGERTLFAFRGLVLTGFLRSHFVQANGGFQHKQHIEAGLPDVLDNPGDLLAFDYRLVNRLSQLLDQFAQSRCHLKTSGGDQRGRSAGSGVGFIYLTTTAARGQLQ